MLSPTQYKKELIFDYFMSAEEKNFWWEKMDQGKLSTEDADQLERKLEEDKADIEKAKQKHPEEFMEAQKKYLKFLYDFRINVIQKKQKEKEQTSRQTEKNNLDADLEKMLAEI